MRSIIGIVLCIGFLVVPALAFSGEGYEGDINVFLGTKTMSDSDAWGPVDTQGEAGLLFDFGKTDWPVNIAVDFLAASATGDDPVLGRVEATTSELALGVRKVWSLSESNLNFHPYLGGGLAFVSGEVNLPDLPTRCEASTTGFWMGAGGFVTFAEHFNIGLDFRHTEATAKEADVDCSNGWIYTDDLDISANHLGLILGYRF